jgi:hypothetical protein
MMQRWAAMLLSGSLACGPPARSRPAPEPAAWLRDDPQRCLLQRDLREGMEEMARRCAEQFVRENGYTEEPAADSTRWVREASEDDEWPRILAMRLGTLESQASTVQCSRRECIVLFRVRRPVPLCAYRAVTLTQVFTKIHLAPGGIQDTHCTERQV